MPRRLCLTALPTAALLWGLAAPAMVGPVAADPTQPSLPSAFPQPGSPVVQAIVGGNQPTLEVRRQAARPVRRRHLARRFHIPRDLDRPALAGVELLAPLPLPGEPPHLSVPMPAYPLDSFVTAFTTPPPPIICPTQRDPDAPDPHLYREVPVSCEPDNP